jgi:hypothetical protein
VWWLVFGLGVGIVALGLVSTGPWAKGTAERAATLFEKVDRGRGADAGRPSSARLETGQRAAARRAAAIHGRSGAPVSRSVEQITPVAGYVPVIDLSPASTDAGKALVAKAIGAACEGSGFSAVGHGVDQGLIDRMYATSRAFFTLPAAEKAEVAVRPGTHGFYADAGSAAKNSGTDAPPDLNEVFVASVRGDDSAEQQARRADQTAARGAPARPCRRPRSARLRGRVRVRLDDRPYWTMRPASSTIQVSSGWMMSLCAPLGGPPARTMSLESMFSGWWSASG